MEIRAIHARYRHGVKNPRFTVAESKLELSLYSELSADMEKCRRPRKDSPVSNVLGRTSESWRNIASMTRIVLKIWEHSHPTVGSQRMFYLVKRYPTPWMLLDEIIIDPSLVKKRHSHLGPRSHGIRFTHANCTIKSSNITGISMTCLKILSVVTQIEFVLFPLT